MSSKSERKRVSHDRIRSSASAALRRDGIGGLSVHNVMENAGLTVGGFYSHYASRGELIADAFDAAASERRAVVARALDRRTGNDRLAAFVGAYLAPGHVEDRDGGCPWGAVLSDLQRAGEPLRTKATAQFRRTAAGLHPDRRAAIATLAVSFSSLMLMRTVTDSHLRDEIAESARFAVDCIIRNLESPIASQGEIK
jgi:TetR/AcrR family transcriptional repressor of nem operon